MAPSTVNANVKSLFLILAILKVSNLVKLIPVCLMMARILVLLLCTLVSSKYISYEDNDNQGQPQIPDSRKHPKEDQQKQKLLELLRHGTKPIDSATNFMLDLYVASNAERNGNDLDLSSTLSSAKTNSGTPDVTVALPNIPDMVRYPRHDTDAVFYFNFTVSKGDQVKAAELHLYKESSGEDQYKGEFTLSIYEIQVTSDSGAKGIFLGSTRTTDPDESGWIVLDVTQAAEIWALFPLANYGLYLKVTDSSGRTVDYRNIGLTDNEGPVLNQPFLVVYMTSSGESNSNFWSYLPK
ncbi:bone morphogenetic protein 5 [Biomphalaria glabrata]|nr:bone morphogenetic protein 5 [Biomphalaria glabrata]